MSLRQVDLNLVPVLQILLRERSVSRTAQLLGLSQPAVSAALRRLRAALEDELLVRMGGQMMLTPRAIELVEPVEAACGQMEGLFARTSFDPATARRTFIIATPDQATFLLAPRWLAMLDREAPGVSLRFIEIGERLPEQLASRDVDFAIMPSFFLEDLPPAPLHFRPLFRDTSVVLFRDGHPLARLDQVDHADLQPYRMLSFHPGSHVIERKRTAAIIGAEPFDVIAYVPQITLPPFLLLDTDYVAIVSQAMAEIMAGRLPLQYRRLAFPTAPIDMGLAWSQVQDAEPAHRWLRGRLLGVGPAGC